jgi:ubiquinone/menaquinone biosynthesis C-methylase UbiE
MTLSPQDWHFRFSQQAQWTRDLRAYLFERAGMENAQRVLEVGCGTGAILSDLPTQVPLQVGLDIDASHLYLAMRSAPESKLLLGDGHQLPYPEDCFDLTLCHFLLLWVDDPTQVLGEMARVTRPGGALLALAEPDYGGRVDYPQELAVLGEWQKQSLWRQGADPLMGRKLAGLFHRAGLEAVETGALGGQWSGTPDWEAWEAEWAVLESDLTKTSEISKILEVSSLKNLDRSAYQLGERVLFVPTFYAWGLVP